MDCTRASNLMMGYFDGMLKNSEKIELFKHIKECTLCSEEFKALEEVISGIEQLEELVIPDNFQEEILDSIDFNRFAVAKRRIPTVLGVVGTLLAISLLNIFVYFRYGSVDSTGIYKYLSSLTQFVNVSTIANHFLTMTSTAVMDWLQFFSHTSLYFKGMIGVYFIILVLLCVFLLGIHVALIRLTSGQSIKGGSIYEKEY